MFTNNLFLSRIRTMAAMIYTPATMKAYANTTSTMSSSMMTSMANALLNPTDSSVDVLLEIIYPRLCGTVTNMPGVKPLTRPRLTTFCQSAPYNSKACFSNRISGTITIPWACIRIALGQTAGTADTNQAGLSVKVTETGNDLPVQMATVYIVPQGDTVAVAFAFTDKKGLAQRFPVPAGRYALIVNTSLSNSS